MTNTDSARLRRWWHRIRPSANSTRTKADRIEGWTLLIAIVIVTLGIPFTVWFGMTNYDYLSRTSELETQTRTPATALILEDAEAWYATDQVPGPTTSWVDAEWRWPGGGIRFGELPVPRGTEAGDRLSIWVDQQGNAVPEPLPQSRVLPESIIVSLFSWLTLVGAATLVFLGVHRLCGRKNNARPQAGSVGATSPGPGEHEAIKDPESLTRN